MNISIIGGDLRNKKLAELFAQDGENVCIYGFNDASNLNNVEIKECLDDAIEFGEIIISGMPLTRDNIIINNYDFDKPIYIKEIFCKMRNNQVFIAGKIDQQIKEIANEFNVTYYDLLEREEMAVLNAIPTAEGAIQIAMEELPITLHGANILNMGFGRIGQILCKMLLGIGGNVYCSARKYSDLAWIRSYGYNPIEHKDLDANLNKFDIIFNTVPSVILDEQKLKLLKKDCLIIDLASKPGGVDFDKAKELGVRINWALALPGKVAPISAAGYMKETIYNIILESKNN